MTTNCCTEVDFSPKPQASNTNNDPGEQGTPIVGKDNCRTVIDTDCPGTLLTAAPVVGDTLTLNGPNGLKRPASAIQPTTNSTTKQKNKKRREKYTQITVEMIQQIDPNISNAEASQVVRDYNHARKLMKQQHVTQIECNPSLEHMIQLINEWTPRSEIICMYVRWSRRLRRNYHLDSISTLLCVSKQCEYKAHVFLKNIKTLTVCLSTTTYGLNFKFHTCNSTAIDGTKLNNQFLGLSITLRLLQRGIVSNHGTFGNVGLKTTGKASSDNGIHINLNQQHHTKPSLVATQPTSRFHTNAGLVGRIWLAIQHRWISIQIVEILFENQLALAQSEQESLAFSFQMHSASGPSRFDFLEPLIGVCLRFRSLSIIKNQASTLQSVWENPKTFVSFGSALLRGTSPEDMEDIITNTFQQLKNTMGARTTLTIHRKTDKEVKWQIIRSYAFHFWLDSTKNELMKKAIDCKCRKLPSQQQVTPTKTRRQRGVNAKVTPQRNIGSDRLTYVERNDASMNTETRIDVTQLNTSTPESGLSQLLSTRSLLCTDSIQPTTKIIQWNKTVLKQSMSQGDGSKFKVAPINTTSLLWNSIRLAGLQEIRSLVSSCLLIHREDGVDVIEELAPLEVYSADLLHRRRHSRWTGPPGKFPTTELGNIHMSISADVDKYIDRYTNCLHVAREDSYYFQEHEHLIPSIVHLSNLCKAILKYGKSDTTRSTDQLRINVGCGGQHKPTGIPETLIGLGFGSSLASDTDFDDEEILVTIGQITEFTWNILCDMQADAGAVRLAPDATRQRRYARHLSKYLRTKEDIGFEDITVVVSVLYPSMTQVAEHIDSMNDSVAGYTRTGAFNVVLCIGEGSDIVLLHLQVICNFRKVIREYLFPFNGFLCSIGRNCLMYMTKWQQNINKVYGGRTHHIPIPFDRSNFFLDDSLPFTKITVSSNGSKANVTGEYLLTEIGPSRVLSLSMFIDPIRDLNGILSFDQILELCFIASVLSNPFWFEYTIASLTKKHMDEKDQFKFGMHPLYDWNMETISVFGSWQGGPYNRWSPFGGITPFPVLFGANHTETDMERKTGCNKLEAIIDILYRHLEWIDSFEGKVEDVTRDLPLSLLHEHMLSVTNAIFEITPCQFSVFRLMIFTTLIIGCGMVKPGIHLKAMMYPVKGSASYKHLMNPTRDEITRHEAMGLCNNQTMPRDPDDRSRDNGVDPQDHDQMMLYLSTELGMRTYLRDETECILCESHPNRNLQCKDWFKKGRRIYDLDYKGNILQRDYGLRNQWTEVSSVRMEKMAYIKV